jgi:hypothetical protein
MNKADFARQLLNLIQNEGLIDSFELKEESVTIKLTQQYTNSNEINTTTNKTIVLNLNHPLSSEYSVIRDAVISAPFFSPETNEIYHDVSLKLYPPVLESLNSGSIDDYYLVGKQLVEKYKETRGIQGV